MARKKSPPARRRSGPSPMVQKLKAQLQTARRGAATVRKKVAASESGMAALKSTAASASGATVAGVVDSYVGGGIVSKAVRGGLGAVLVAAGGFVLKGSTGSLLASAGAGMIDTVAYEGGQAVGEMVIPMLPGEGAQ